MKQEICCSLGGITQPINVGHGCQPACDPLKRMNGGTSCMQNKYP